MTPRRRRMRDYAGRIVRLTEERWHHILEHTEMVSQEHRLRAALREPEKVLTSYRDPTVHLYYRFYARSPVGPKHLIVAVKILDQDAFIITAFYTDEVKGGTQIWPR